MTTAYYSNELKCWVRLDREFDGEFCHTSGYKTKEEALGKNLVPYKGVDLPKFLTENNDEICSSWQDEEGK
jgi:hypothetical protein